jgi:hypothetical protein
MLGMGPDAKEEREMNEAIDRVIEAANADYDRFMPAKDGVTNEMAERFKNGWEVKVGKKYIKLINRNSVWGFIVNTDDDVKFRKGDILKPAGWAAPARNAARGNVLDGGYTVNWTGPLYL